MQALARASRRRLLVPSTRRLPPPSLHHLPCRSHARTFSSHQPPSEFLYPTARRRWLLIPAGGLLVALYTYPKDSKVPLLDLPHIIPTSGRRQSPLFDGSQMLSSFNEPHPSMLERVVQTLCDWIWEPFWTGIRFVELSVYFLPVILSSPMLLVGKPSPKLGGDTWGAVWWYGFLTRQMQRAGPTFIKVSFDTQTKTL